MKHTDECDKIETAKEAVGLVKDLAKLNVVTIKSAAGFSSKESRGWAKNDPARNW